MKGNKLACELECFIYFEPKMLGSVPSSISRNVVSSFIIAPPLSLICLFSWTQRTDANMCFLFAVFLYQVPLNPQFNRLKLAVPFADVVHVWQSLPKMQRVL